MKRRNRRKRKQILRTAVFIIGGVSVFSALVFCVLVSKDRRAIPEEEKKAVVAITKAPSPIPVMTVAPTSNPEEEIYTYLQGPKSWAGGIEWSGEWGEAYADGGYFGSFGCGLCCLANVYSSQTEYQCSPMDMYGYAKKSTYYSGGMAIDWGYMRRTLTSLGFDCRVEKKPPTYEQFVEDIAEAECSIVLVSSANSQVYWQNTPGHYVTIFLYDAEREKVFLADSGDPEHNRQWIKLRKIYKSLKTSSSWQYLSVGTYDETKDQWKHKKINGNWVAPEKFQ